MVQKGTVVAVQPGGVRILPLGKENAVTPLIKTGLELSVGDVVAFVLFDDGTGIVIQRM